MVLLLARLVRPRYLIERLKNDIKVGYVPVPMLVERRASSTLVWCSEDTPTDRLAQDPVGSTQSQSEI